MISQTTPDGLRPAMRARSTEASVWPMRSRTPPGFARRPCMWPGETRSAGVVSGADVRDRLLDRGERRGDGHGYRLAPDQKLLDVLRQHVDLEVHGVARLEPAERRHLERVRDERDGEALAVERRHRERDAVDRN